MLVIAIPNQRYPPDSAALAQADLVISTLSELTRDLIDSVSQMPRH
jgi:hypothetical protein